MVAARIAREYTAQVAAFATTLLDRLLLTALIIRIWGVDGFAAWTVALSVAGMIALADFGLSIYFGNRLFFALEQGDRMRARHMLSAGNLLLGVASVAGSIVAILAWGALRPEEQAGVPMLAIVAAVAIAGGVRQSVAVQLAVYRAHREFARQTWIVLAGDAGRICVMAAALLSGVGLTLGAGLYLAATLIFSVMLPLADQLRRYPAFRWAVEVPAVEERRALSVGAGQYGVQSFISTLFTFAPVFALAAMGAGAFAVAQFALMRTLANLARAVLQLFANVFGLEVARRVAIGDAAGAAATYAESTRFVAVQTAAAAGALWAVAPPLFALWTGDARLYDPWLFCLAIAAPLLLPSLTMAVQLLVCANWPRPLAAGRLLQLVLTVAAYGLLAIDGVALRLMAALAIGELVGLGLMVAFAVARRIEGTGIVLHVDLALRSLAAAAIAWGCAAAGTALGGSASLVMGCVGGAMGMLLATLLLALSPGRRTMLIGALRKRLSPATRRA